MIIDATNLLMGRLASYAAKQAMLGYEVNIINSEKAVISGKKENTFAKYLNKREMGTQFKGPFIHRKPERILKRAIRGMLPYKKSRGRDALSRVKCYFGLPKEFEKEKAITIEKAHISKMPTLKYVNLKKISERLGAKIE